MSVASPVGRVIVVVLDGLRPDAIARFELPTLSALLRRGAYTLDARTVTPSVTACAMSSLFTGAPPHVHGMQTDKFGIPRPKGPLDPMPRVLRRHGLRSAAHMAKVPLAFRPLAHHIARTLGVDTSGFHGDGCAEILAGARRSLRDQRNGLILMHWPDADRAGHSHSWMSAEYGDAARRMDEALGEVIARVDLSPESDTALFAVADHGGGGADPRGHDSSHTHDQTIPVIMAGGGIVPGAIRRPVSLLDVPATVLWALGIPQPASYVGTPIADAFVRRRAAA